MDRTRRNTAPIDYQRLDSEGVTAGVPLRDELRAAMADGGDSDLLLNPINDEDSVFKSNASENSEQLTSEQEERLLQEAAEAPQAIPQDLHQSVLVPEKENVPEQDPDTDLGRDEVWDEQKRVMEYNRQKRERARLRLQRERQIAEEKLREAQEREELRRMEAEIKELNQKRSVTTNSRTINKNKKLTNMAANSNMAAPSGPKKRAPKSMPVKTVPPHPANLITSSVNKKSKKFSKLLMQDATRSNGNEADDEVESIYAFEADDNVGLPLAVQGAGKVRTWLSSTEDVPYVHETRSDPGDTPIRNLRAKNVNHVTSHSSKALRDTEAKPSSDAQQTASSTRPKQKTEDRDPDRRRPGRPRTPATSGRSRATDTGSSDGESHISSDSDNKRRGKKSKKIKSGFLDKPKSHVIKKLRWPHMNQNHRYVTSSLGFNELTFNQFVGGECRTIARTSCPEERLGRLRILSKVAYLFEQCKNWDKARGVYYAIVSSIEEGDMSWDSNMAQFDLMCPPYIPEKSEQQRGAVKVNKVSQKKEFFCRDFQKGECSQAPPHRAWVRSSFEIVEHFCAQCYKAKLGKLMHAPGQENCMSNRK